MVSSSSIVLNFFFPKVPIFLWFGSYILSINRTFTVLIFSKTHFSMTNSIPKVCYYILSFIIGSPIPNNFWLTVSCLWECWFFYYDLWSLHPPVHFLSICLSGIIVITICNGGSTSPWNIPLWILPLPFCCKFLIIFIIIILLLVSFLGYAQEQVSSNLQDSSKYSSRS